MIPVLQRRVELGRFARQPWHTRESDPGCARGEPTCRAVQLRSANRRCAITHQPNGRFVNIFIN